MKKIISIACLSLVLSINATAQHNSDDLRRQMHELQQRMQQMVETWSKNFGDSWLLLDTMILHDFQRTPQVLPFDTSLVQRFWMDQPPVKWDTLMLHDFRSLNPADFPSKPFSSDLVEQLEQMLQRFFDNTNDLMPFDPFQEFFQLPERPTPLPAPDGEQPRKKRKTTIL